MKKILLAVAAFICMNAFVACNSGASTASETTTDSLGVVADSLTTDSIVANTVVADSVVAEPACDCAR